MEAQDAYTWSLHTVAKYSLLLLPWTEMGVKNMALEEGLLPKVLAAAREQEFGCPRSGGVLWANAGALGPSSSAARSEEGIARFLFKKCKDAIDAGLEAFQRKDYLAAIDLFNTALELPGNGAYRLSGSPREYACPSDAEEHACLYNMACCYAQLGQQQAALTCLESILESGTVGVVVNIRLKAFSYHAVIKGRKSLTKCRSSSSSSSGPEGKPGSAMQLNEDMLAQLRSAQEEAARLKQELARMQQEQKVGGKDVVETKPKRIDSTDNRETLWGSGKRSAWLSEADVDFFTGGGVTETSDTSGPDAAAQALISRRLAAGAAITAGLLAFALVPTKDLRLKPQQPLYFYITQLLQAQAQLGECATLIEDAQWDSLRIILPRIRGNPTNAESALSSAIALLDAPTAAKAEPLAGEFLEYLDAMDYNKYFDAMPTRVGKLKSFLALMPLKDLEEAKQQVASQDVD
eukprot:gene3890-4144_t